MVDVRDEQILPAVAVQIRRIDAHARSRLSGRAVGDAGGQSSLTPSVPAPVHEQEVLRGVVGDEQIDEPVVVDVGGDNAEGLAERSLDLRAPPGRRKGPVAVVVEQEARRRLEEMRNAVVVVEAAVFPVGAQETLVQPVLDEAADEEIQQPIVVVIEPDGARRPPGRGHARFCGHIGERPIAVVAIEQRASIAGDEDVRPAIVVVVADRDAHAERPARHAGLVRHVGKGAIAIVPQQRVLERRGGLKKVAGTAVHQVDVHPPVVVEIEEGASGTERFREESRWRPGVLVRPGDAARRRRDFDEER